MNKYLADVQDAMYYISQIKNTVFLGQSVKYPGSSIFASLEKVSKNKRLEMPVFEDTQMGLTFGMSLNGYFPISCFPRYDFLILAFNQMINHMDKVEYLTNKKFNSKIFIRTMIGSRKPLHAGPQHTQDLTSGLKKILKYIKIREIKKNSNILKIYKDAIKDKSKIFLFVEDGNNYSS